MIDFILRNAGPKDLDELHKLSQLMEFINLPSERKLLQEKLLCSEQSFSKPSSDLSKNYYFFVLEDKLKSEVVGACMIHAQHGTETEPHFFLKVDKEEKYCKSINTGFIHGTLQLGIDTNGPTEIGGLVLNPKYRGHSKKLGKQLSLSRFLYMALYPERFKETIHAELLPPFDDKGNSPLWEAIGRRFLNMDYHAADLLSRKNKEFILNLFPRQTIYETLLPIDARDAIGKVGPETQPVKKMLEKIGFNYTHEVDPFDGGPHFRTHRDKISLIQSLNKKTFYYDNEKLEEKLEAQSDKVQTLCVKLPSKDYFSSCFIQAFIDNDKVFCSEKTLDKEELSYIIIP